jgi:drug/metabolite transporter (DMT)-like permease
VNEATETTVTLRSWVVLIFLSLVWGTSYILIKKGLIAFSPYQLAALRLTVSALAFLPILLLKLKDVNWKKWLALLLVGLTGTALPSFLFPLAQTQISSSIAGMLNSLTPLSTLIIGVVVFSAPFAWSKLLGVLLGLGGAAILIMSGEQVGISGNAWYSLFIILATICYATSSNIVGYFLRDMSSLMISAASFVMVGLPAIFYLFSTNFVEVVTTHEFGWQALGYVVILALASTVLASILFFKLVQDTSPVFSSTVSYIVPIIALFWGAVDGEPITLIHFMGMALILFGVNLSRK